MEVWNNFKSWINNNEFVRGLVTSDSFIPTVFVATVLALILKPSVIILSLLVPAVIWILNNTLSK